MPTPRTFTEEMPTNSIVPSDITHDCMNHLHCSLSLSSSLQYTEKEGLRLGLCGWVKNTNKGTVVGQVQGPADMICEM